MRNDGSRCAREAEPVDQTRVVQRVAEDVVLCGEESGEDPDVELKAAREHDGIRRADVLGELAFDLAMDFEVSGDEPRGGCPRGTGRKVCERGVVGEAEVVIAAQTDDFVAVEAIVDAASVTYPWGRAGQISARHRGELGVETPVVGVLHGCEA